jgi:glycosyltransferase involved in cell wall biosynthesis
MRVLHITPSIADVRGGTSRAILGIATALQAQGVKVDIVTTDDNGPDRLAVPLGKAVIYQGVPVHFFPRFSPPQARVRDFAFSSTLRPWLAQAIPAYDLLHTHALFSYPGTVAMQLARQLQVPYLNQPHGLLCEWSLQQSRRKKHVYLAIAERTNLNHSHKILVTAKKEQQEVDYLGLRASTAVVPLGIDLPQAIGQAQQRLRQKLDLPAGEPIILFLSRLHPKKGLDYLIPALGKLTHHRFTVVVAGNGEVTYESEIKALIAQHGLKDRTRFLGFVEGEAKELLLQGSNLFTLTSHSENFGVSVLEAMAAGLPILITPGVALAPEVKAHYIGYCPDLDIQAIAQAIEHALTHPDNLRAMGDRARQLVLNHYTWDRVAAQLIDVYAAILEKSAKKPPSRHKP